MLCYRCGSYNADGSRKCEVCGQSFSAQRRHVRHVAPRPVDGAAEAPYGPGSKIAGRYRITGPGGSGASGWVMRARDEAVDVDVALKLVAPNLLQAESERSEFLKSVQQVKKSSHPNLIRVYDCGKEGTQVYYSMPYVEGLSLRKIIDLRLEKGEVFGLQEVLPIMGQLAAGLEHLERLGGHGALRPSNVIVLPELLKITGLPHFHGLPRRPFIVQHSNRGELHYLAPEARKEEAPVKKTADVYSMAVILGEMLTGTVPGESEAWEAALERLGSAVAGVLQRGLNTKAESRHRSATRFFDAVAEAAGGIKGRAGRTQTIPATFDDEPTVADPKELQPDPLSAEELAPTPPPPAPQAPEPSASPEPATTHRSEGQAAVAGSFDDRPPMRQQQRWRAKRAGPSGLLIALVVTLLAGGGLTAAWWWRKQVSIKEPGKPTDAPSAAAPTTTENGADTAAAEQKKTGKKPSAGANPKAASRRRRGGSQRAAGRKRPQRSRSREPPRAANASAARDAAKADTSQNSGGSAEASAPSSDEQRATNASAQQEQQKQQDAAPPPPPQPPQPTESVAAESEAQPAADSEAPCPDGMIHIQGGSYLIGSRPRDPMRGFGDQTAHKERLVGYCIDIYEFPNRKGTRPRTGVTWRRARALCKRQGKRLCTESEWEHACSGAKALRFPFGNQFRGGVCNVRGGQPAAAGRFSECRSPYGVADMSGNVAEWTRSRWSKAIADRVVKGGAAGQADYTARCAARTNEAAGTRSKTIGFRCCRDQQ